MNAEGKKLLHKNIKTDPQAFLKLIAPYRDDLCVAVECMFSWYWLSDLCFQEKIHFVLGHALYMKAIHGGKAKSDRIDSEKIAILLKGGNIPQSYVYPPEMRSTRDLMRRRTHFVRRRGEFMAHIKNTNTQYNMSAIGNMGNKCDRIGVAERFGESSTSMSVQADLDMVEHYDTVIKNMERHIETQAKFHNQKYLDLLRAMHGVGQILSLTLVYEIENITRFPSVQQFISYSRLVKCSQESAGKRKGTGGAKMGNVHLKWAFSEMALLFIRNNDEAKKMLGKLERKHGKPKALSIIASRLGRAVYHMLKRNKYFDMEKFMKG